MNNYSDQYSEEIDAPNTAPGKDEGSKPKWNFQWHGEKPVQETRPQLIKDLIPEVGVGLIAGQWGTYKTFCALDLAAAVMSGGEFVEFPVLRQGGVLFLACEGQSEVSIRLEGVLREKCANIERAPFAWVESCPRLLDKNAGDQLTDMLRAADEEMRQRFDLPLVLVIIDTYGRAAGYDRTGQENDAATGKIIMRHLSGAALAAGVFIVAVDHFGKVAETGTRGSSSKEDDADVVLALLGDKDLTGSVKNVRMAIRKRRSGANGDEFPFKTRTVNVGAGGLSITTLVLDWSPAGQDEAKPAKPGDEKNPWAKKTLKLLRRVLMDISAGCGQDLRPYSDGPLVRAVDIEVVRAEFCRDYPASGDDEEKRRGAKRKAFKRSIDDAHAAGLIGAREVEGTTYIWFATAAGFAASGSPAASAADA